MKSDNAQGLLKQMPVSHIMSDLLDGFDRLFLNAVAEEQERQKRRINTFQGIENKHAKIIAVHDFKSFVMREACKFIVKETQECILHPGKLCPLYPDRSTPTDLWVELISPSCVHWSQQGTKEGWLGQHNLALIAWAITMRQAKFCPDMIILECTPALDLAWITELSLGRVRFHKTVLSPKRVGMPTAGRRVWAIAASGRLAYVESPYTEWKLQKFLYRSVVCTPSAFLFAEPSEVHRFEDHLNSHRDKLAPHPRGRRYRSEDYVGSAAAERLHLHRLQAAQRRISNPALLPVRFFVDISQHKDFTQQPDGTLPRQLTSTLIFIEELERVMCPVELLAAQGPWGLADCVSLLVCACVCV